MNKWIKADSNWIKSGKKVYNTKTREVYGGKSVSIVDCFRAYSSLEESVADYYDLITKNTRYAKAVNEKDSTKAITAIREAGYATDPNYVSSVTSIIKSNNLTQYDKIMSIPFKKKENIKPVEKKETVAPKKKNNVKLKVIKNTVTADVLNVRGTASISSKVLTTVKKGVNLTFDKIEGKWVKILYLPHTVMYVENLFN